MTGEHLRRWLLPVGSCHVEGRIAVVEAEQGFLGFNHFTQEASSGTEAVNMINDAFFARLHGPIPPLRIDFANIPFGQERRERNGKHFPRLYINQGHPNIVQEQYEIFIREN